MKSALLLLVAALAVLALGVVDAAQQTTDDSAGGLVKSRYFTTRNTHPPFRVSGITPLAQKAFQVSLATLPESTMVASVLSFGGPQARLTAAQQQALPSVFASVYADIAKDSEMNSVASVLPHCLSSKRPSQGHYFVYLPADRSSPVPAIVFLHGFGGNFLFYIKVLKDHFPDHAILAPT